MSELKRYTLNVEVRTAREVLICAHSAEEAEQQARELEESRTFEIFSPKEKDVQVAVLREDA